MNARPLLRLCHVQSNPSGFENCRLSRFRSLGSWSIAKQCALFWTWHWISTAKHGSHRVLNYAFKTIPNNLSDPAKRFVVLQAVNLAVLYPYLAPILNEYVFQRHHFTGIRPIIRAFIVGLIRAGIQKIYPDAIAHGIYYSLIYRMRLRLLETNLLDVVDMGRLSHECIASGICTVLWGSKDWPESAAVCGFATDTRKTRKGSVLAAGLSGLGSQYVGR